MRRRSRFCYVLSDADGAILTIERVREEGGRSVTTLEMEYVWGIQYVDEVLCSIDYSGTSPVRREFVQDANWNVITLLESNGDVEERYRYDPYGMPVFMEPNGDTKTTATNSTYLFQVRRMVEISGTQSDSLKTYHFRHREALDTLNVLCAVVRRCRPCCERDGQEETDCTHQTAQNEKRCCPCNPKKINDRIKEQLLKFLSPTGKERDFGKKTEKTGPSPADAAQRLGLQPRAPESELEGPDNSIQWHW